MKANLFLQVLSDNFEISQTLFLETKLDFVYDLLYDRQDIIRILRYW